MKSSTKVKTTFVMKGTGLLLFIFLFFSGCEIFKDTFTIVEGHVTDLNTGTPIEGIRVSICSRTTYVLSPICGHITDTRTNQDEYYLIEYDLSERGESYKLSTGVTKQYYSSGEINIRVGEKNIIDIQLKPQ